MEKRRQLISGHSTALLPATSRQAIPSTVNPVNPSHQPHDIQDSESPTIPEETRPRPIPPPASPGELKTALGTSVLSAFQYQRNRMIKAKHDRRAKKDRPSPKDESISPDSAPSPVPEKPGTESGTTEEPSPQPQDVPDSESSPNPEETRPDPISTETSPREAWDQVFKKKRPKAVPSPSDQDPVISEAQDWRREAPGQAVREPAEPISTQTSPRLPVPSQDAASSQTSPRLAQSQAGGPDFPLQPTEQRADATQTSPRQPSEPERQSRPKEAAASSRPGRDDSPCPHCKRKPKQPSQPISTQTTPRLLDIHPPLEEEEKPSILPSQTPSPGQSMTRQPGQALSVPTSPREPGQEPEAQSQSEEETAASLSLTSRVSAPWRRSWPSWISNL